MDLLAPRRRLSRRSVPLLLAGIIGGAAVLSPVMGSAATFLTKRKGDRLFLQNSSIVTSTVTQPPSSYGTASVSCPPGQQALSGGADSPFFLGAGTSDGMILTESKPTPSSGRATGWTVEFLVGSTAGGTPVTVHAVCAP